MKKALPVIALFLILGVFVWQNNFHKVKADSIVIPNSTSISSIQKPLVVREKLKESKYSVSKSEKYKSVFPIECDSSLTDLSSMTSEEYKNVVSDKQSFNDFFGEKCLEQFSSNEVFKIVANQNNCNILAGNEKPGIGCLSMMFVLKSYFIADHTAGMKIDEMSSQELAANFVKMFFSLDKLTKETFQENLKLINALYEKHKDDPDVIEATIGYMIMGSQITQDKSVNSKVDAIFDEAPTGSFKVDRLRVFRSIMSENFVGVKATLDNLNNNYASEPELAYYYAAYFWKMGDKNMANLYIDKAISLGSKCTYCTPSVYVETKAKMAKAKEKIEKIFALSIGLTFENL